MEKKLDIRAFQDGKDYVLVFRDCSPELKDIVKGIVNPVSVPDLEAESMSPTEDKAEYKPRFESGPLEGRTPVDVLLEDGDEGYRLLRKASTEDTLLDRERKEALALYKALRFREMAQTLETLPREEIITFIKTFATKKYLIAFIKRSGYEDGDVFEFLKVAKESLLKKLIKQML